MRWLILSLLAVTMGRWAAAAPTTEPAGAAKITLATTTEDGKKMLVATVTADGKPLENIPVTFQIRRTFGNLVLGVEKTLDDGTAAVAFPEDLPNGAGGGLVAIAETAAGEKRPAARAEATFAGAAVTPDLPFPRALWAPRAPLPLVLSILCLLAGVWTVYAYVVIQLLKLRKGASSCAQVQSSGGWLR